MQNSSKKKNASKLIIIIKIFASPSFKPNDWQHNNLSKLEVNSRRNHGTHAMQNCHPVRTDSFISIYRPLVSAPLPFKVHRPTTKDQDAWKHRNKIMNKVMSNTEADTLPDTLSKEQLSPSALKTLLTIASHQITGSSPASSVGRKPRQIAI